MTPEQLAEIESRWAKWINPESAPKTLGGDFLILLAEVLRLNRMVDVLIDAHVGCHIPENQCNPERCKQACTDKCLRELVEREVADKCSMKSVAE